MNAILESLGSVETGIQSILDADAAHHTESSSHSFTHDGVPFLSAFPYRNTILYLEGLLP